MKFSDFFSDLATWPVCKPANPAFKYTTTAEEKETDKMDDSKVYIIIGDTTAKQAMYDLECADDVYAYHVEANTIEPGAVQALVAAVGSKYSVKPIVLVQMSADNATKTASPLVTAEDFEKVKANYVAQIPEYAKEFLAKFPETKAALDAAARKARLNENDSMEQAETDYINRTAELHVKYRELVDAIRAMGIGADIPPFDQSHHGWGEPTDVEKVQTLLGITAPRAQQILDKVFAMQQVRGVQTPNAADVLAVADVLTKQPIKEWVKTGDTEVLGGLDIARYTNRQHTWTKFLEAAFALNIKPSIVFNPTHPAWTADDEMSEGYHVAQLLNIGVSDADRILDKVYRNTRGISLIQAPTGGE